MYLTMFVYIVQSYSQWFTADSSFNRTSKTCKKSAYEPSGPSGQSLSAFL